MLGLDNVDQEAAKIKNIRVINAVEGAMNAVAELVLGLMLSLARQTARGDREIRVVSVMAVHLMQPIASNLMQIGYFAAWKEKIAVFQKGVRCGME